jgi:hypothetical protein
LQAKPHDPDVQVALPFAGTGHAAHDGPHAVGSLSDAHLDPHACSPVLHVNPHVPAVHVALAPTGETHTVHAGPHAAGFASLVHAPLHA